MQEPQAGQYDGASSPSRYATVDASTKDFRVQFADV
jgi:hypothetical protein